MKALPVDNDAMAFKIPHVNNQTKNDIEFIKCNLTPKREFPVVCNICDSEDHYYSKCPLVRRDYKPLKELSKEWISLLERVCRRIFQRYELTVEEFQIRLRAIKLVEDHLKATFAGKQVNVFYLRIYVLHLNRQYQLNFLMAVEQKFSYPILEYFVPLK